MSAKSVIETLAAFVKLHRELNEIANQKVAAIKSNDMSALEELVRLETAKLHQLQLKEKQRGMEVAAFFDKIGAKDADLTISGMLPYLEEKERELLEKLQRTLVQEVDALKKQNETNQQLIEESLRFVNMSLDLLLPDPEDVYYQRPQQKERHAYEEGYSIFDSKA
ncbi:flagellar protein FlgN [Halalkalibacterium ligniniphilum]|uniref:flagellar protein FlgN n=1 Tax=Halalkalibacterium ligniniphilum TaxID=1134413 RepID=UPI000347325C|nr:flagellar protein FlgN [Halalkalibacterium ligniniphilum]